jgi:hypothetical protein
MYTLIYTYITTRGSLVQKELVRPVWHVYRHGLVVEILRKEKVLRCADVYVSDSVVVGGVVVVGVNKLSRVVNSSSNKCKLN